MRRRRFELIAFRRITINFFIPLSIHLLNMVHDNDKFLMDVDVLLDNSKQVPGCISNNLWLLYFRDLSANPLKILPSDIFATNTKLMWL